MIAVAAFFVGLTFALAGPLAAGENFFVLQSTTSTQNSGLFAFLLPKFTAATGIEVRVVAVGTGQALNNARNGDGDAVLVHAREDELAFVAEGHGVLRCDVMYNDFVLVGPADDPAGVREAASAAEAFARIAAAKALFLSRGDRSGTHQRERQLWRLAGLDPDPAASWYREAGAGMGATLNMAAALDAYTLSDRATWIAFRNKGRLAVLFEGDEALFNQYGIMLVNPERHPGVRFAQAKRFRDWLVGPEGQRWIAAFRVDGQQLFVPNASCPDG